MLMAIDQNTDSKTLGPDSLTHLNDNDNDNANKQPTCESDKEFEKRYYLKTKIKF